jgi:Eukaryotic mitochondrial regulator protein
MGAYTADGQLRRVVEAKAQQEADSKKGGKEGERNDTPKPKESEDNEAKEKDEDDPDEGGSDRGSKQDTSAPLPPETARDWAPFPLNRTFISQPVLSDELREEIWLRVMKDEKTVREVSAELGVEMRRVGAVVRLKEVEKEWERLVSLSSVHNSHSSIYL